MVVDGSNLATEGRTTPSLAQLDEAVQAFHGERPNDEIIVVVDASFGYRIDESERKVFEEAEEAGEIVSPPAGAIGRGDGFLLRIADRIDADVLSNDSFQEFHGEYAWLFEDGRLVGGKPVPNVGWIFTPRTPVRGPKSRVATRDADRARRRAVAPAPRSEPTAAAISEATAEAISPEPVKSSRRGRWRGSRAPPGAAAGANGDDNNAHAPDAINEPLPFITFIADHPLGTEVEGVVEGFTSHGAFVVAGGARCYAPVSGLGDPPPRSAKEVLAKGETRTFVIQALDPPRRGIELALPGLATVAGAPTEETVEAEIDAGTHHAGGARRAPATDAKPRTRRKAAPAVTPAEPAVPAKPRRGRKAAAPVADPGLEAVPATGAEVAAEAPPAKARRSRKATAPADADAGPAAPVAPAPVKSRRGRKAAP
ncbi:MAG: NYN domain-containing protein, partial [Acidimicrobiales bacterium]